MQPRTFGPLNRFDPHVRNRRQKPQDQRDRRGVIYFADDLACGIAEAFPEQYPEVAICPNHRALRAAPREAIPLLDLTADGAMRIGAVATLGSGDEPRRLTQRWGRAIYEDLADLAGIRYRGAHQGGCAIAAWERVGALEVEPGSPSDGFALAGPLWTRVTSVLERQGRVPRLIESRECPTCVEFGLAREQSPTNALRETASQEPSHS